MRFAWRTVLYVTVIVAVTPILTGIQRHYLPIVGDFQLTESYHDNEYNHDISGYFTKYWYAPQYLCEFDKVVPYVKTAFGYEPVGIVFSEHQYRVPVNRPTGSQVFGPWKIKTFRYPEARKIRLDVHHNCLLIPGTKIGLIPARTRIDIDLHIGPEIE